MAICKVIVTSGHNEVEMLWRKTTTLNLNVFITNKRVL